MQSSTVYDRFRVCGEMHGTAMYYDASNPDADSFLAYMETWLPTHGWEAYLEGFMEGKLGEHKRKHRHLRAMSKAENKY